MIDEARHVFLTQEAALLSPRSQLTAGSEVTAVHQSRCLALERALDRAREEFDHQQSLLCDETDAEITVQGLPADARQREAEYNSQVAETQQ